MSNLEEIIQESIEDVELPEEPTEEATEETPEVETVEPEPAEALGVTPPAAEAETPEEATEPAPEVEQAPQDDFEKKFGIPAQSLSGRENRIPYPRVRKIVDKAVTDKAKEVEATYAPRIQEFETKIKDYEGRLGQVAEFEKVMVNDPEKFLNLLSTIPAYQSFFKAIDDILDAAPAQPEAPVAAPVVEDMPVPNSKLPDGSAVYDMDGLKSLLDWQARQVESRLSKQFEERTKAVEERYAPLESEWQAQQRIRSVIPQVQAQVADARTWPLFSDNEDEITKVLQDNPKISLEGAYRQVVFPKLTKEAEVAKVDKDKMRQEMRQDLLKELRAAPKATSAPITASKPVATVSSSPRPLEEVIAEAVKTLK